MIRVKIVHLKTNLPKTFNFSEDKRAEKQGKQCVGVAHFIFIYF